ncbi:hypothetical protein [Clostridium faecium]|uniref:Uncharacterized protein n=1 Tax=Clostridium faecium TaxID=2762223 RepID=A0ABR8YQR8_9CLOT|nr:hypothetical protein [Clostridium faecium]MBD8046607.1 hypothetical protein [Clostridium faecium]
MGRRKPSMFSKNYEKQMRRRKQRYIMLILACIIIGIFIIFSLPIKQSLLNVKNSIILNKDNKKQKIEISNNEKNKKEDNNKTDEKKEEENKKEDLKEKEESIKPNTSQEEKEIKLSENITVKVVIENKNNDKKIVSINDVENITSDISPSGKQAVFEEKKEQRIFLMNINGELKEITKKEYLSTEGEAFSRESVIQYNPGYIWGSNPRFVDDKNIVYISYLPWINADKNQYVWTINLQSLEHNVNYNLTGKDIKFGKVETKGLTINIDGRANFLNGEGNITY